MKKKENRTGKKLRLKKQSVKDLDPKKSGQISGGQGGGTPKGGTKPIDPING
jgi:hypothetical protein